MKKTAILAFLFFTGSMIFHSCKEDIQDPARSEILSDENRKILELSKKYYESVKRAKVSKDSKDLNVSNYSPKWNNAIFTKTEEGHSLAVIPLSKSQEQTIELNIVLKNDNVYGIIKRFTYKDQMLYIYSGSGWLKTSGFYNSKNKTFKGDRGIFKTFDDVNGGELDDVFIMPDEDLAPPILPLDLYGPPEAIDEDDIPTDPYYDDPTPQNTYDNPPPPPLNVICKSTFKFTQITAPNAGQNFRGWKEASVANLVVSVAAESFLENIWNVMTGGSSALSGRFNLEVGVPGDLPDHIIVAETTHALNKSMADLERSHGIEGIKTLINTGVLGIEIKRLMELQLQSHIPGARVSNSLSGRTTPQAPKVGLPGC